jgi:hypothetical protein
MPAMQSKYAIRTGVVPPSRDRSRRLLRERAS